jgi:hypothetical protein
LIDVIITEEKMSDSSVIDWSAIIHKDVKSNDGVDIGIVDAIDGDYLIIGITSPRGEYKLPKSEVNSFNGLKVSLNLSLSELGKYKV